MALTALEKVALVLRLGAGAYLDPATIPAGGADDQPVVEAVNLHLETRIRDAWIARRADLDVSAVLRVVAEEITADWRDRSSPVAQVRLEALVAYLLGSAAGFIAGNNGDGLNITVQDAVFCQCGLLPLAAIIEARVRSLLGEAGVGLAEGTPPILYQTGLPPNNRRFPPYNVDGRTFISERPRRVAIAVVAKPILAREWWHIVYTLHHELVCHAFQGALAAKAPPDAEPACSWSEGWMDSLARDLVIDWALASPTPTPWLLLSGPDAVGELWRFHDARYADFAGNLLDDDIKKRRGARKAYQALMTLLPKYGLASSSNEAEMFVRTFSLKVNTHPDAEYERLRRLALHLQLALNASVRPQAGVTAARACLAFVANNNLSALEAAAQEASWM